MTTTRIVTHSICRAYYELYYASAPRVGRDVGRVCTDLYTGERAHHKFPVNQWTK